MIYQPKILFGEYNVGSIFQIDSISKNSNCINNCYVYANLYSIIENPKRTAKPKFDIIFSKVRFMINENIDSIISSNTESTISGYYNSILNEELEIINFYGNLLKNILEDVEDKKTRDKLTTKINNMKEIKLDDFKAKYGYKKQTWINPIVEVADLLTASQVIEGYTKTKFDELVLRGICGTNY